MKITLINAIYYFCKVLDGLIFVRVILSWFPIRKDSAPVQLLYALTEPILGPIRNILFKSPLGGPGMMLDFSPIIAFFLIEVLQGLLVSIVRSL